MLLSNISVWLNEHEKQRQRDFEVMINYLKNIENVQEFEIGCRREDRVEFQKLKEEFQDFYALVQSVSPSNRR